MTDRPIPESVMQFAKSILDIASDAPTELEADTILARALMARDERAARIARGKAPIMQDMDSTAIADVCDRIANAILSEDQA